VRRATLHCAASLARLPGATAFQWATACAPPNRAAGGGAGLRSGRGPLESERGLGINTESKTADDRVYTKRLTDPFPGCEMQTGKIPRIAQLLALAILFEEMVRTGEATNYAELARLGCVSRERLSQLTKLRWLAPDIQGQILSGSVDEPETEVRRLATTLSWHQQRLRWREKGHTVEIATAP
jgi:hypothetical protein